MSNEQAEFSVADVKREAANEQHKKEMMGRRMQLIIFKLGGEEYALPIDQIKEVVLTPRIAKMPQTPHYIKGVANIRGNIIAILDLEQRFKLSGQNEQESKSAFYTLVVESELHKAGILVKEVPNTLTVYDTDIDNSSSFIQYSTIDEKCIKGVVKSGDRLIILLDMITLIEAENIQGTLTKSL